MPAERLIRMSTRSLPQESYVRTYTPKPGETERQWHIIDAEDVVLGRLPVRPLVCCGQAQDVLRASCRHR